MAVSQNGWPVNPARTYRKVPGTNVRVTVADGPAGDVLMYTLQQFDNRVENLDAGEDDWGWADRPIRGSNETSNHASATAVDANATKHPLGASGTFSNAQEREIRKILGEVDNVVRWGGDYSGRKDEMHFEINAGYNAVKRVADRLDGKGGGSKSGGGSKKGSRPTLEEGDQGSAVELVQRYLGINDDGIFGPKTDRAVKDYQRSQGLAVDGVVGPKTWARIDSGLGNSGGSSKSSRPTLRRGAKGEHVRVVQRFLGTKVDGIYGPKTERAVKRYQRMRRIAIDGVVGPVTWKHIGL